MLSELQGIISDQCGTTFIESGLWIAMIILVMVSAGHNLASSYKTNIADINNYIVEIPVPKIGL